MRLVLSRRVVVGVVDAVQLVVGSAVGGITKVVVG